MLISYTALDGSAHIELVSQPLADVLMRAGLAEPAAMLDPADEPDATAKAEADALFLAHHTATAVWATRADGHTVLVRR